MSDRSHGCGRGCIHIAGFDIYYAENQKASKRIEMLLAVSCRADRYTELQLLSHFMVRSGSRLLSY